MSRPPTPRAQTGTGGGGERITGDHWYGCKERQYFDKLTFYAAQGDDEAFKGGLAFGIAAGDCTFFKDGEAVYIADTAILSGLVKVRRRGKFIEYWTHLKAVRSPPN